MRVCTLTFHPNAVHNSGQHERNHLCVPCLTLTPKIPTRFRGTHVRNDCAPCTHSKYFTHHWTDHLSPMKLSRYFRPDTSRSSCPVGAVRSALPSTRFPSWICTMVLKKKLKKNVSCTIEDYDFVESHLRKLRGILRFARMTTTTDNISQRKIRGST